MNAKIATIYQSASILVVTLLSIGCTTGDGESAGTIPVSADNSVQDTGLSGIDEVTNREWRGIQQGVCPEGLIKLTRAEVASVGISEEGNFEDDNYLRCVNISGIDLSGMNLMGSTRGIGMSGSDMSNVNLSQADMAGAYLTGTNLAGADLSGADLQQTWIDSVDFSGANLESTILEGVQWEPGSEPTWPTGFDPPENSYRP